LAQLSDDCFAFGGPLMSVDTAAALIGERLEQVGETETVGLAAADGRVLSHDLVAPLPLPPFTNSAVDGFAVRSDDMPETGERALGIAGRVQAGSLLPGSVPHGQAVRIFTGAPMPDGLDTVFMQEDVRLDGAGLVVLPSGLKKGANVRPTGEDIAEGSVVLASGHIMRPQDVALFAAFGRSEVEVRRRIRVAVVSTGNEIVPPGASRAPSQIYDSNRFMLMAMLRRLGCEVTDFGIVADDRVAISKTLLEAASGHDLILASGGVSTGDADHVKVAVEDAGTLVFWRIAIKPGRPVAMGVVRGAAFIGLPGNPAASFVTFVHIARKAILALAGARPEPPLAKPVRAAFSYRKKQGRREYARASLHKAADDVWEAVRFPREGAGLLSSLVQTDGLVEIAEHVTAVQPGETVSFLPYASLL
jgi:molybdopterin molybdotransferase